MGDGKMKLGMDVTATESKPFVAYTQNGCKVIVKAITIRNTYGDILYTDHEFVDGNPTEEEIFKIELANPQEFPTTVTEYTVEEIPYRPKDS